MDDSRKKTYTHISRKISEFVSPRLRRKDTYIFARIIEEVSGHFDGIENACKPIYTLVESREASEAARTEWHAFVLEYNETLNQWKAFVERVQAAKCDGTETHAKPAHDFFPRL